MEHGEVLVPGYTLERELGRGAMGVVYLAAEDALGRRVALKVLREGYGDEAEVRHRFEREVRAAARLRHAHIVPVLSTGESRGRLWYAMELVPGPALEQVLQHAPGGRIAAARAVRIVRDVARALEDAHAAGVVHRDVKPGNVLLLSRPAPAEEAAQPTRRQRQAWIAGREAGATPEVDHPLLTDFGLAADREAARISVSGMLIGTPGYMAPEQFQGRGVGPAADQWALGVMLYECLTGRLPFPTEDLAALALRVAGEQPIPPSRLDPRIDRDLETALLKCLEKDPRDRYASCAALAEDLTRWLLGQPIAARPPGPWRRLRSFSRRRPALATGTAALLLGGLVAGALWLGLERVEARRIDELRASAHAALEAGSPETAEELLAEWALRDPGDPEPLALRERARALRTLRRAQESAQRAEALISLLHKASRALLRLRTQASHGSESAEEPTLGRDTARGSEPWWMRDRAYHAAREVQRVEQEMAQLRAEIASLLAGAATALAQLDGSLGPEGEAARAQILEGAAAWHLEEWRRALARGDAEAAALQRLAVLRYGPGPHAAELRGERLVTIAPADPPAEGWLFCYVPEGDHIPRGGPRLIPLPFDPEHGLGAVPEDYAAAVRRSLAGEGEAEVGPDQPSVSGPLRSTPESVATLEGPIPRAAYEARLDATGYPLVTGPSNALGELAGERTLALPQGRYLLLVRRPGRPDLRLPFEVGREQPPRLDPNLPWGLCALPRRFVLVPGGVVRAGSDDPRAPRAAAAQPVGVGPFLAARFEVTVAEYFEFLNDPRTLAEIDRHIEGGLRFAPRFGGQSLVPREPHGASGEPGRFLPVDNPEQPVAHVCLFDLVGYPERAPGREEPSDEEYGLLLAALDESRTLGWGYLAWRSARSQARARAARAAGGAGEWPGDVAQVAGPDGALVPAALRFTLPTPAEWERMARGGDGRRFVYGDEREWLYFKGARSRAFHPAPEPVGLFAADESVFGVRDLTGSVAEWTAGVSERERVVWIKGHSWGSQVEEDDRIAARQALSPDQVGSTTGIRLIARVLEPMR